MLSKGNWSTLSRLFDPVALTIVFGSILKFFVFQMNFRAHSQRSFSIIFFLFSKTMVKFYELFNF